MLELKDPSIVSAWQDRTHIPYPYPYRIVSIWDTLEKCRIRLMQASIFSEKGWSRSWDERVGLKRLLKKTQENLKKVTHDKKRTMDKYVKPGLTSGVKSDGSLGERQKKNSTLVGQKRKREHIMSKGKDSEPTEKPFGISIPPTLRKQLVDDCEFVNQMRKLVRLPRSPNVDTLIQNYREYRGKKDCLFLQKNQSLFFLSTYSVPEDSQSTDKLND